MNCKYCGAQIEDGAKFCVNCGNKIEIEEPENNVSESFKEPERVDAEIVSEGVKPSQPTEQAEPNTTYERVQSEETTNQTASQGSAANNSAQQGPAGTTPKAKQGPIGFSIASLVCGILGLLCCCCGFFGAILSLAGVALGIVAITEKCEGQGMAIAGIVCGGLGLFAIVGGLIASTITGSFGLRDLGNIYDMEDQISGFLESL